MFTLPNETKQLKINIMNTIESINTRRKWLLIFEDGVMETITLTSIYSKSDQESNWEYNYALNAIIDEVLDMKVNETIYFQHNRDDENSKSLLTRIK
tara:strand:- start:386 stop:676 length:291 start_codon:yes stop_codon:yes gene_type:complete